ncbi:M15 family metallopeptidase [Campylobacter pinnipediorum]|nr:M15 family metallopeptidase [Campylobacter pinnipediorum]
METFKYRNIAGTNRLSTHSYAIAIDINVKSSNYWRWHKNYKI